MKHDVIIRGEFVLLCWNKDGSLAWRRQMRNGPTSQGLGYLAGAGFDNAITTKINSWNVGLIDKSGFTGLSSADTNASHAGWSEFTGYTGSRPAWANSGTNGVINSSGPFSFPILNNGTIHGAFIVSSTGNVLWCTAILTTDAVVTPGQNLTGTYSVQLVGS